MQLIVRGAMIVVMLLHGIFGCCWHHGHDACCTGGESGILSAPGQCSAVCCHNPRCAESSQNSGEPSESPAAPDDCCSEGECVYLDAKVVDVSPIIFLALASNWDVCPSIYERLVDRRIEIATTPPLYLSAPEACALLQVWRI